MVEICGTGFVAENATSASFVVLLCPDCELPNVRVRSYVSIIQH